MAPPRYVAPAQTMILVNGIWIDDAEKIEYQVIDRKTPVYGYNDRLFRSNMLGQTLVQGTLCINFRFPGYLNRAILAKEDIAKSAFRKAQFERFGVSGKDEIRNLADLNTDEVIAKVAREYRLGPAALDDAITFFSAGRGDTQGTTDVNFDRASSRVHNKVELILLYGNPKEIEDPERVEVIQDPQFTSMGKVIRMDVPSGGQPILEEYSFYAKDVVDVKPRNVG